MYRGVNVESARRSSPRRLDADPIHGYSKSAAPEGRSRIHALSHASPHPQTSGCDRAGASQEPRRPSHSGVTAASCDAWRTPAGDPASDPSSDPASVTTSGHHRSTRNRANPQVRGDEGSIVYWSDSIRYACMHAPRRFDYSYPSCLIRFLLHERSTNCGVIMFQQNRLHSIVVAFRSSLARG